MSLIFAAYLIVHAAVSSGCYVHFTLLFVVLGNIEMQCNVLLPERVYITFGYMLSQIRLSSVMFVHATRGFFLTAYLVHPLTSVQNFMEIVPGKPL